jgi:aspartate-semialdehyde dehydrogenase
VKPVGELKHGGYIKMIDNRINKKENKTKVAVLGATGLVGQVFVYLLSRHPFFQLDAISSSGSRDGKKYGQEVQWALPFPIEETQWNLKLESIDPKEWRKRGIEIVFSALPTGVAKTIEPELREIGFYVFSNASALRYEEDVPILIPEANPQSLDLIRSQGYPQKGFVVTNANCSTTGLAVALAPLKQFAIQEVFVSTYQSISGAGYPGLSALDILSNAIPHIANEEEKLIIELKKILELDAAIYPHCVRIPVPFGHLETLWLTFDQQVETSDIREAWQGFRFQENSGPSFPQQPVYYSDEEQFPQPAHSFWGTPPGMQVFTGKLRKVGNKIGFSLLVNNLVKGAAGGSIQNAELFLKWRDKYDSK